MNRIILGLCISLLYLSTFSQEDNQIALSDTNIAAEYYYQAIVYLKSGENGKANELFNKVLELYEQALSIQLKTLDGRHPDVATMYSNMASVYLKMDDIDNALTYLNKALYIQQLSYGENHIELLATYADLGRLHEKKGNYAEAISHYKKAINVNIINNQNDRSKEVMLNNRIAYIYYKQGSIHSALNHYETAYDIQLSRAPEKKKDIILTLHNIVNAYILLNDYDNITANLKKILILQKDLYGENHPEVASTYGYLGKVSIQYGSKENAISYFEEAILIRSRNENPEEDTLYADDCYFLGSLLLKQGNPQRANIYFSKAVKSKQIHKESRVSLANLYTNIGIQYYGGGFYERAVKNFLEAISLKEVEGLAVRSILEDYEKTADAYLKMENYSDAYTILNEVIGKIDAYEGSLNSLLLSNIYNNMGITLNTLGRQNDAIVYYEKALYFAERIIPQDMNLVAVILENLSKNYNEQKDNQRSIYYLKRLIKLKSSRYGEYSNELSMHYNDLGNLYQETGKNDSAQIYFEKSLKTDLNLNDPDARLLISRYLNLSNSFIAQGESDKALRYLIMAKEIEQGITDGDNANLFQIYTKLGIVYKQMNQYDLAEQNFLNALKINDQNTSVGKNRADVYNHLGDIKNIRGDYSLSLVYYGKALDILLKDRTQDYDKIISTFSNLGTIYISRGDFGKALENYESALDISSKWSSVNNYNLATIYNNIGIIYNNTGDTAKALAYYEKALDIQIEIPDRDNALIAKSYTNIGGIYISKGDNDKAQLYLDRALDYQIEELGLDHPDIAFTYSRFANIYFKEKKYDKAEEYLLKALNVLMNSYGMKHPLVAFSYNNLGMIFHDQQKYSRALEYYQKALISNVGGFDDDDLFVNPQLRSVLSKPYLLESLKRKANALYFRYSSDTRARRDLEMAMETFDLSIDLMDLMRNEFKVEDSKLFLSEQTKRTFSNAISVALELNGLLENGYLEKGFEFVEKSKSASLLAQLYESEARRFSGIPDQVQRNEKQIKSDLLMYQTLIQKEKQGNSDYDLLKISEWTNRYSALSREYDSLVFSLEEQYPRYYNLKYGKRTVSVGEIQSNLPANTVMIEYFLGNSRMYIFTISRNLFKVTTVPLDNGFEKLVVDYYRSLKKVETRKFAEYSYRLYNYLIRPVMGYIRSYDRLLIIPDDYLFYVPFETLVSEKFDAYEPDFTKYEYLIRDYVISYHYSASIWLNNKLEADKKYFGKKSFVGFAPEFGDESGEIANVITGDLAPIVPSSLPSLYYAREEVKTIRDLFKQHGYKATSYLSESASEENFKDNSSGFNFVHIATHGFTNDDQPEFSGLIFSGNSKEPSVKISSEDGVLYSGEMYNLEMEADLVVLSSCESGVGKLIKGEGLIAITRGFLYSGTMNIVFSLWRVSDVHTMRLMVDFYNGMLNNENKANALRDAKLKMIESRTTAYPKMWGGFVLIGVN